MNDTSDASAFTGDRPVWLFDGHCVFCAWSVRFLLAHERTPSSVFVAIQSQAGRVLAARYGIDPDTPSTFLFIDGGRAFAKSDGVIALAAHLSWPWRALGWLRIVPKRWRDALYDFGARNRFRILGRRDSCASPPPELRARFVLPD